MRVFFTPENLARAAEIKTNERLAALTRRYGRVILGEYEGYCEECGEYDFLEEYNIHD